VASPFLVAERSGVQIIDAGGTPYADVPPVQRC
jgi:hypothetical protein